ncbi:mitochondrial ATPase expression-domain-containing protein [Dactylonectria macrodidyma]|uniref:Mitochondrial ATPase expression-domain-containing protein n=1 Tax=Dactylonectria macrodidyma TaxID=307937 RepID=A0A9P9EN27_9HYPO|nr:mitochondrial ATPase expression-domain-containing protein [Dactylonectria macrodidyma]
MVGIPRNDRDFAFPDSTLCEEEHELPTALDRLLRAIQCRDVPRIIPDFLEWANRLNHDDPYFAQVALEELRELPIATFSEILRWIDPVANPAHDVAHGLNITLGQTQFIDSSRLVDEFGVRVQHREVLDAVNILMEARQAAGIQMLIPDYEVFIRCAGAASDKIASVNFFGASARDGKGPQRNTSTWTEFTKAIFLTDPTYYQFDRTRVISLPRLKSSDRQTYNSESLKRIGRMKLNISNLRHLPFNRQRERVSQELRMLTRMKYTAQTHWDRSKRYGVLVDEKLLCATMVSFARSNSLTRMKGLVLQRGFGISLNEDKETGQALVGLGKWFRKGNPREPTKHFLNAIVEAFGSMSRIRAALGLLVNVSRQYGIQVPHETWSNLLHWAYVCSSKPYSRMYALQNNYKVNSTKSQDVIDIWHAMTSDPFNVTPTFEDYNVYIKSLIAQRKLRLAVKVIREEAVPFYRQLEDEHLSIVLDEVLQGVTSPGHQRRQMEAHKEHVWFHIASWFTGILKGASRGRKQREGDFTRVIIPNLLHEFGEFFHHQISYRSTHGHIQMTRSDVKPRFNFEQKLRTTLPNNLSGVVVKALHRKGEIDMEDPNFVWPQTQPLEVLDWKRKPIKRRRARGTAPGPNEVGREGWWKKLEQDLSI